MKIVNLMFLYICYTNAFIPSINVLNKMNIPKYNICFSKKINYKTVSFINASIPNDKQKIWENHDEYTPKQKEIVDNIDKNIEELFDEDSLFTDIRRETKYNDNNFNYTT